MVKKEVEIGSDNVIEVALTAVTGKFERSGVIGYGTTKRANVTSSISSINQKELKDIPLLALTRHYRERLQV
jgi:hypothetical protein